MTAATGVWDAAAATHLYRRAAFGAPRGRVERAVENGPDETLTELFDRRAHDPALVRGIRPLLALEQIAPLQAWWMSLILADGAPLVERVALMWHDHFATSFDKVNDVRLMHAQLQLFREKGLGRPASASSRRLDRIRWRRAVCRRPTPRPSIRKPRDLRNNRTAA